MTEHLERVGQIVGDYRLVRWLGGGGFGNVYLADHIRDGSQVAIKVLQIRLTSQDDWRSFINEARTFRLRHPHIVSLLDFGLSSEDKPFLVMEYAPQGTLRQRHPRGSHVTLPTVVEYAAQIAAALQYAHDQHLVHRDVKPENMLVRADGTLLLSDFGIATAAHSTHSLNANQGMAGTIPYIAPEQLQGKPRPASDQYALGIVIYEWLTGRCPFQGTTVEVAMQHMTQPPPSLVARMPDIPQVVEEVLFNALAKDPKERFASVQAFATALRQASAPPSRLSPIPSDPEKPPASTTSSLSSLPAAPQFSEKELSHLPTSIMQEPVALSTRPVPEPATSIAFNQYSSDITPQALPIIPPMSAPVPPPVHKRHLSKGYAALLLMIIVLLIVGGSYAYSAVHTMQVTAATVAHQDATATVRVAATATVKAARDAYNANVAQRGIMFGFDAGHTHNNSYEHILNSANVSQLQQAWTASTGDAITSAPTVANGMIYAGSWDHNFYAFDTLTGHQKWKVPTGNDIFSSAAVDNGVIYVGSADGKLYAFDAITGQQKWTAPIGFSIIPPIPVNTGTDIASSPAVDNGVIYVGSNDKKLYAFDAATGKPKWGTPTGDTIQSSPAVVNGVIYVGSNDKKLYAFDAATGKPKWGTPTNSGIYSSPAVANGVIYVGSNDHRLYAFDATTGHQKWSAPTGSVIYSSPAVANGIVYVGSNDHRLYAFDAATGHQKWSAPTGDAIQSSPTVANGVVYVGSWDGKLYAFDATTGQQKWAVYTGGIHQSSSPTVANGVVYIGSFDGQLYAFSLPGNAP